MKPQERVTAIVKSDVGPLEKCVLFVLASHMSDTNLSCFVRPETLAVETRMAPSTVKGILRDLCLLGVLTREDDGHRSKVNRIEWTALAAYRNPKENPALLVARKQEPKRKGSKDGAGGPTGQTVESDSQSEGSGNRTAPSVLRTPESVLRTPDNDEEESVLRTEGSVLRTAPSVILTAGVRIADADRPYCGPDPDLIRIYDPSTPPTPSFDSTVADPANGEVEEDTFQQSPETPDTQQPKSLHEPEQTMDPNEYNHDDDVSKAVSAALEEAKIRKLSMTGITGVDAKDIPVGYFARHIEDPEYTKGLWKDIADRAPKEKIRELVPLDQLPPDPEMDAVLAKHWESPVTVGIPCLIGNQKTDTPPPDDEPPKTFLRRSTMAPVASNAPKKPVPVPLPPPPRISANGEVQTGDLFGRRPQGAPVAPVAIVEEVLPTTMLPPEVTDFVALLANRPDGSQAQPVALVQRWIRALVNAGITSPKQLEETTFSSLKFTSGIGENIASNIAKSMIAWGSSLAPDVRTRMHELRILAARNPTMPPEVNSRDRRWLKAANISWNDIRKMTDFNVTDFAKRIESARSAA